MAKNYYVNDGNKLGYINTGSLSTRDKAIKAKVDITKGQVVEISADFEVQPATADSDKVLGVAMIDAKAGKPISVECEGLFLLTSADAVTAGGKVIAADDGKIQAIGETGANPIGVAINTIADAGEVYVKFSI